MATELTMPQMGYDMQEGTVVRWLKAEGAEVKRGEPIAEIETDKAVVEFQSYADGLLQRILVHEGRTVPVGEPIALVGDAEASDATPAVADVGESETAAPPEAGEERTVPSPPDPPEDKIAVSRIEPARKANDGGRVRASPVARRIAEERGIDLTQVVGTGPGGRVTREDVEAHPAPASEVTSPRADLEAEEPVADEHPDPVAVEEEASAVEVEPVADGRSEPVAAEGEASAVEVEPVADGRPEPVAAEGEASAADVETVPLTRMRRQIARVTVHSKTETPHFYVSAEVDMTRAMEMRQQINSSPKFEGVRVSVNDLILKACVEALRSHPKFNAAFTSEGIRIHERINVAMAIAGDDSLIVPAIKDAHTMSLRDIAIASRDLAERAKGGTITAEEYTSGTFTVSNLGMFEVSGFAAIIHPPQSAVIAVGSVAKRPVVRGDRIEIADVMTATVSADHRIVDGAEGALFIGEVKSFLENPYRLLV